MFLLYVWNAPAAPSTSNVPLVPTRASENVLPWGFGTATPLTLKLKRYVSGAIGAGVVTLHSPLSSFVIGRPFGPPPIPIGMTSATSLLVTETVVASGAQVRNVTRLSGSCSTAL